MNQLAAILSQRTDSAGFIHTHLKRPAGFDYRPGQYVAATGNGEEKPRYLALASHPHETDLLLVSRHTYGGDVVSLSAPQGNGFGCDYGDSNPMLFITHGTGISALRPAILERRSRGFQSDALLYGIADEQHEPDLDVLKKDFLLAQLRAYSQADKRHRVQQVLPALDCRTFGAVLLIGGKEMMADVKQILAAQNFPTERIFSNF